MKRTTTRVICIVMAALMLLGVVFAIVMSLAQ